MRLFVCGALKRCLQLTTLELQGRDVYWDVVSQTWFHLHKLETLSYQIIMTALPVCVLKCPWNERRDIARVGSEYFVRSACFVE